MDKKQVIKFLFFVFFLFFVIYIFRYSTYSELVNYQNVKSFVNSFGILSYFSFIIIYALLTLVSIPGLILTFVGAVLFGTFLGTLLNLLGATLGACLSFYVARFLGRSFVESLMIGKLKKFYEKVHENAFMGILFVRLIPIFPFIGVNFGAGLCKIKFKDYAIASFIGMIPGTFVYTYFFATLGEKAFSEGIKLADLFTPELITPIILFILLIIIPLIYKMRKNEI